MTKNIEIKQSKKKETILEHLKKAPIIQLACERTGISRQTFYRWKKEDKPFADDIEEALVSGASIINDLAESKLIAAIKEGNTSSIFYWLNHRHPAYATRVELAVRQPVSEQLTPEQEEIVKKALTLAALTDSESPPDNSSDKKHG